MRADPRVSFDPAGAEQALELMHAVQRSLARVADASLEVNLSHRPAGCGREVLAKGDKAPRAAITTLRKRLEALTAGERDDSTRLADIGEVLKALEINLEGSDAAPTEPQQQVLAASDARLERATTLWREIRETDLAKLNATLGRGGLAPIAIPPPDQLPPARSSPGKEMP